MVNWMLVVAKNIFFFKFLSQNFLEFVVLLVLEPYNYKNNHADDKNKHEQ